MDGLDRAWLDQRTDVVVAGDCVGLATSDELSAHLVVEVEDRRMKPGQEPAWVRGSGQMTSQSGVLYLANVYESGRTSRPVELPWAGAVNVMWGRDGELYRLVLSRCT